MLKFKGHIWLSWVSLAALHPSHLVVDHPVRHLSATVILINADVSMRGGYYTIKMFQENSVCGVIGSV